MKDRAIKWVILAGSMAILSILAFQVYWISQNYQIRDEAMDQQIQISLRKVAEILSEYNYSQLPAEDLILRRSTNYYVVNVNDHIDANLLEFYLRNALIQAKLDLDFEYAIYDCERDQMVYGDYCSVDELPAAEPSGDLPSYDQFTYYFGVRFPQLRSMIFSQMNITLVLSSLLLITLLFFAYALYVILSQKRYTDLQKDFINNMTHEFKTPISSISIAAKTLMDSEIVRQDERLKKYAEIMHSQAVRLDNQVEKVLDLARLEGYQSKLKLEDIDMHDLLNQIKNNLMSKFQNAGGSIKFEDFAQNPKVKADLLHLTNVLYNLLDNSFKYADHKPEVVLSTRNNKQKFYLSIKDSGIGMDKAEQQRAFEKFYRVPTGNVHNAKGFGLGLYYVKRIAGLHGWDIVLKSEKGKGTEFIFEIPNTT